jgi:protein TonB
VGKLKTGFWVSCCLHCVVLAASVFIATTLRRQPENSVPLIQLVDVPVTTPPQLLSAPAVAATPTLSLPVVPAPKTKKQSPVQKGETVPPVVTKEIRKMIPPVPSVPNPVLDATVSSRAPVLMQEETSIALTDDSGSPDSEASFLGAAVAQPRYRDNPEPSYPFSAQRRHQEGTVVLLVSVNASGQADAIAVKESSGFATLDDAARKAVRHWTFDPARSNGSPIASKVEVPIRFQLSK